MTLFESVFDTINNNRANKTVIPFIFKKLRPIININKKRYYLIAGDPGTGKSAWLVHAFVLGTYISWKKLKEDPNCNIKLKINLFSMERSSSYTIAKILGYYLLKEHKILLTPVQLLSESLDSDVLSEDVIEKIKQGKQFLDELEDVLTIYNGPSTPHNFEKILIKNAKLCGRYEDGKYIQEDKDWIILNVIDQIGLFLNTKEYPDNKQTIDAVSRMIRIYRDSTDQTFAAAMQFNRNVNDTSRVKGNSSTSNFVPTKSDFKGSGNVFEDADVVIALINPKTFGVKYIDGYTVEDFIATNTPVPVSRLRTFYILKNSYGADHIQFSQLFIGEIGIFKDLPISNEIKTAEMAQNLANLKDLING